ncbi:MAG: GNAT family N-acetyltransferase [Chloroflexota bacterium]|nr:GNAT family N-acetyltransferase [Chloroflexota bacterium]
MTDFTLVKSRKDIAETARLAHEIWNEHYTKIIGQAQADYMMENFQSASAIAAQIVGGYEYYLILNDGEAVGYLAVAPDPAESSLQFSKLYVLKDRRGGGIGKESMDFVNDLCRKSDIKTLWLTVNKYNAEAIAWYERLGFARAGEVVMSIGGGYIMDDFRFEKKIG